MNKPIRFQLAALSAAMLIPGAASAQIVIDDFERGSFYVPAGIGFSDQDINEPAHCISPKRSVFLSATLGGGAHAELTLSPSVDDGVEMVGAGSGVFTLYYNWDYPIDLTAFFDDELVISCEANNGGNGEQIRLTIFSDIVPEFAHAETTVIWDFANFDLADYGAVAQFANLMIISIEAPVNDLLNLKINDIRTARSVASIFREYNGELVDSEWPPVPGPPIIFVPLDEVGNAVYKAEIGIWNVDAEGTVPLIRANWREEAMVEGAMAVTTFDWPEWLTFSNTHVEMFIDVTPANGETPELISTPPDPTNAATSFALNIPVLVRDGSGNPTGSSHNILTFDIIDPGVTFTNVAVIPQSSKTGSITGFRVSFDLRQGNFLSGPQVFETTWIGDWATTLATDVAMLDPELRSEITAVAVPSVTRGSTEIRMSQPLAAPASMDIFDVSGRLVRQITANRGDTAIRWDGRTSAGVSASSGTYFARINAGAAPTTARIVRVR